MNPEIFFNPPPPELELLDGEIHAFCAVLDPPRSRLERCEQILSADERARAARFAVARNRNRFVAGRGLLREILGGLLRAEPAQLVFAYGENGKPRLAAPVAGRIFHFNVAHSDALAVYLVSGKNPVGVDVERLRRVPEAEAIAARFFSASENAAWRALPAGRQTEAFFECWTRKEALLKAVGSGLGGLENQIQAPSANAPAAAGDSSDFSLHRLVPARGYLAAAAIQSVRPPVCWQWPAG